MTHLRWSGTPKVAEYTATLIYSQKTQKAPFLDRKRKFYDSLAQSGFQDVARTFVACDANAKFANSIKIG